jgi:hypothetical protein
MHGNHSPFTYCPLEQTLRSRRGNSRFEQGIHQTASAESIARRERCSVRKINMTISFLAPDLVKAAIVGRLPHGMGVARLTDLLAEWSRQHQMLGLPTQ